MMAATLTEVSPMAIPASLDLSQLEFSPDIFSAPQPPGTDFTSADTDLLLHSLLAELGPEFISLPPADPSPSLSQSPSPVPTPPPAQVPLSPTPSSSSSSSVPEAPAPNMDTDDPFLVNFADLDGLLKDSTLFENPASVSPSSDVIPNPFAFPPLQDVNIQDPLVQDLSECLSLCSPSLSPHSDVPLTPHTAEPPQTRLSLSTLVSLSASPETSVLHDHTYTSSSSLPTSDTDSTRKRKTSAADSLLSPVSTDSDTPLKRKKPVVKDDKYHTRRQKNNVASQVSRSKRRTRHRHLFSRVDELEKANAELREKAKQMEAEAEQLRKRLVQKLSA